MENTETTRIINKLTDNTTISRAEYELLLRDKVQLDLILQLRLEDNYRCLDVVDIILKARGMKA